MVEEMLNQLKNYHKLNNDLRCLLKYKDWQENKICTLISVVGPKTWLHYYFNLKKTFCGQ